MSEPASRLGQAFLSPMGVLYLVVSDPWIHPWVSETEHRHDLVAFVEASHWRFHRAEGTIAELERHPGWTRLA